MSDSSHFKLYFKKGLSQNLLIVLFAALIGFSINWFRPDGISVVGDWSIKGRVADDTGATLVIPLSEATILYEKSTALFLKQLGFPNTQVLVNGWTVWQEINLPVEGEAFEL